jgi:chemotaxis protein MotB
VVQSPPRIDQLRNELARVLADAIAAGRLELIEDARGLVVSLPERATFAPASTEMTASALELVAQVAIAVQPFNRSLRIEGHTDNVPIHTREFQSNWELSTARAATVIRFLIERVAFDPRRLSAAGYGEFHPRVANDSPENRARNRRVDIVVLEASS